MENEENMKGMYKLKNCSTHLYNHQMLTDLLRTAPNTYSFIRHSSTPSLLITTLEYQSLRKYYNEERRKHGRYV